MSNIQNILNVNNVNQGNLLVGKLKFEDLKTKFDQLIVDYEAAKTAKDATQMAALEQEFVNLKSVLFSNEAYFLDIKNRNLNKGIKQATTEAEKDLFRTYKYQRQNYRDNSYFISNAEKASNVEEFIIKNNQKKRNFVKRNFKKFVAGALVAGLLIGGGVGLKNKLNKNDKGNNSPEVTTEAVTEQPTEAAIDVVPVEQETEEKKLGELPELNALTNGKDSAELSTTASKSGAALVVNGGNGVSTGETTTSTEEAQDPHVDTQATETTTTTEEVVPEEPVEEPEEKEYTEEEKVDDVGEEEFKPVEEETDPTHSVDEIDPTKPVNPTEEKVTIIEVEEPEEIVIPENPSDTDNTEVVIEVEDEDTVVIPTEEKVTIEETEEKIETTVTDNSKVEETSDTTTVEETKTEEKVTVEEKEEKTETTVTDDSKIEETSTEENMLTDEEINTFLNYVDEYTTTEEKVEVEEVEETQEVNYDYDMEIVDTGTVDNSQEVEDINVLTLSK